MGGSMSGNSRSGRRVNEMPPSTTITRDITIEKTGRSMQI